MDELERLPAARTIAAGNGLPALLAEQRAGEGERGAGLAHAARAVEEQGARDAIGAQQGGECALRTLLVQDFFERHGSLRAVSATRRHSTAEWRVCRCALRSSPRL